jgi:hypothetical protein
LTLIFIIERFFLNVEDGANPECGFERRFEINFAGWTTAGYAEYSKQDLI